MTEKEKALAEDVSSSGRRGFMVGAGSLAGLAVLGSTVGARSKALDNPLAADTDVDGPLPYAYIEPNEILPLARSNHIAGMECGMGSFATIIEKLREEVGEPYYGVPTHATYWAGGGGAGWGTVCGALVGSNTAISVIHGNSSTTKKLVDELQRWYTQHKFPQYTPPTDAEGMTEELPTAHPEEILCHVSVTNWCRETGYASGSAERSERCHRLTAETAAKAVELLNAEHEGNFDKVATAMDPATVDSENGCRSCHFKGDDFSGGQFTRGKMECMGCHGGAPHLPDSLK